MNLVIKDACLQVSGKATGFAEVSKTLILSPGDSFNVGAVSGITLYADNALDLDIEAEGVASKISMRWLAIAGCAARVKITALVLTTVKIAYASIPDSEVPSVAPVIPLANLTLLPTGYSGSPVHELEEFVQDVGQLGFDDDGNPAVLELPYSLRFTTTQELRSGAVIRLISGYSYPQDGTAYNGFYVYGETDVWVASPAPTEEGHYLDVVMAYSGGAIPANTTVTIPMTLVIVGPSLPPHTLVETRLYLEDGTKALVGNSLRLTGGPPSPPLPA